MPPEPLPWDRKELRKHDSGGGGSGGLGFAGPRWREAPFPHHHPYNHHQHHHNNHHHGGAPPRWLPDFRYRPPPGHGKQGSRHLYLDDFGHGFMTSRPNEKMVDDEGCRPSGSGRYGRNSRESRGSFGPKEWKGHSLDTSLANGPGRPNNMSDQRSVDNMPLHNSSIPSSDSIILRDQSQPKDQHDINGASGAVGGTGQKLERENSLNSIGWKPLNWTRSGSLSSRGSGFSHSSSSKSMAPESDEVKVELMPKNVTSTQSPLADAAVACMTPNAPPEETNSRKKPRLGWGEGLAKYEKKKVEGADDSAIKNGATVSGSNSGSAYCQSSNLTEKSARVVSFSDCASPATPSSVACSSSPGVEEKLVKAGFIDHDSANLCSSPSILSQNHSAGSTFDLENLDLASFSHLNLSINELLQSDDPGAADSSFVRSTAMNKLLVLKNDVSKVLEATESEIDMLENELKSLISEPESSYPCLPASGAVPPVSDSRPCEENSAASGITLRPAALEVVPSGYVTAEDAVNALNDEQVALKDEDIDSPGSATSKLVQMPSSGEDICAPNVMKDVEDFMDPYVKKSGNLEVECSVAGLNEEKAVGLSSPGVGSQLVVSSSAATTTNDNLQSGREEISYELILASNRDWVHSSSEEINKLLPTSECHIDISSIDSASCLKNGAVKERFLRRKRSLQLKERIITLKFKMFRHLWKEDMPILSLKKLGAKSQKKCDFSLRILNSGLQKHRSSIRSRYASTAASLRLEPKTEMINYASRLLSEPQVKPYRNVLKMPSLILDKWERIASRFISINGLVEDPCTLEKERSLINPWTSEEKKIYLEKFAIFGKNFRKIASFLDHKTTADCIEFYYKNHKSDSFEKTKKPDFEKRAKSCSANNYLVASQKRWNREASAVSLDILGAASAIAANVDDIVKIQQTHALNSIFALSNSYRMPRGDDGLLERSNSIDLYNDERETVAADVLAGICGSLSSEAMSSCITSSVDPGDGYHERKYQRAGSSTRRPLTPEVTQNVDEETCSDESCGEMDHTDWTDEEKLLFIQAVSSYGRDFAMISRCVRTRSRDQCKVFFSKARKCLGLDSICHGPGNPAIDDPNGGSDMEDACVLETDSVICSEKSGFKTEIDVPSPDNKLIHDCEQVGITKPDLNKVEDDNEGGDMDSIGTMLMLKNLIPDGCQMEDKPDVDFDRNCGIENGVTAELISVQDRDKLVRNSDLEAAQGVGEAYDHILPKGPGTKAQKADANAAYMEDPETKLEGHRLGLCGSNLNVDKVVKDESSLSDINDIRCLLQDKQSEGHLAGNDFDCIADTSSSRFQHQTDLEMDSAQNPCIVAPRENNCSVPLDAGSKVSATTKHGKSPDNESLVVDFAKISDEHRLEASRTNELNLSGHSAVEHLESSNTFTGLPVPLSTVKEINGDISCKKSIQFQSCRQSDVTNFSRYSARDSYLRRCSSSKPVSSGAELSLPSQEKLRDCSKPTSGNALAVGKPCSNGDVKLFGQILSKPLQQKPNMSAQQNEDNRTQHHDIGRKSSKVKNSSKQAADAHSAPANYEISNFVGSENLALRSFNFWDQSRMQNSLSSMPESAILLGKYPSAFGNYSMPSSKMDPVPSHGVGKNGECSLNSVSVFPTRDTGDSNGLADFQVYRNCEMRPFTIDMRQRQDMFSDTQRKNGFDVVSGMQQQSRGMVGINVVGRGGVLVGGQCTSISDPVAAIRMHYAKAEQFSGQAGNMIRDDDSWLGKGNVGSR